MANSVTAYYECVTTWLKASGSCTGFYQYSSSQVDMLLHFIKPCSNAMLLVLQYCNYFFFDCSM